MSRFHGTMDKTLIGYLQSGVDDDKSDLSQVFDGDDILNFWMVI